MNDNVLSENLRRLANNPYPGRGLIVGLDETGEYLVQVYWIMGRSENSRNRVFEYDPEKYKGTVYTTAADPAKIKDPSLIFYNAMREYGGHYVASNGDQTDTVIEGMMGGQSFARALAIRQYEPDAPNYTPRITALCVLGPKPEVRLSILRKSPDNDDCLRAEYSYSRRLCELEGMGWCITTYDGDGDPLPSFKGEPYALPLRGTMAIIASTYRQVLHEENVVSVAVKFISIRSGKSDVAIINKYKKI